jgi:hypothetical protein
MATKPKIRATIRALEAYCRTGLAGPERPRVDLSLGLLYEAYAQATLDEHGLGVDVASICGFVKYIDGLSLGFSASFRLCGAEPAVATRRRAA